METGNLLSEYLSDNLNAAFKKSTNIDSIFELVPVSAEGYYKICNIVSKNCLTEENSNMDASHPANAVFTRQNSQTPEGTENLFKIEEVECADDRCYVPVQLNLEPALYQNYSDDP